MRTRPSLLRFLIALVFLWAAQTWGNVFRIPYQNELTEINPLNLRSASGAYIHHALFRNWLWVNDKNELTPDLAETCKWKGSMKLICRLKKDLKWSNGDKITSKDFIQTYEFLLSPENDFTRKEILFSIVGARKFAQSPPQLKENSFSAVGIKATDDRTVEFSLEELDPELEFKLALPMSAPVKQKNFNITSPIISSGPYKILSYDPKSLEIKMESNPNYPIKTKRPDLLFIYISDDSVQIPMFSKEQIDIVRRVPTAHIPHWKKDKSFKGIEVLRFDYFGFDLNKINKETRKAMSEAIDYNEWQSLLNSTGRPGCFDFSETAISKPVCYEIKKQKVTVKTKPTNPVELVYSHLGGEDHQRTAEWLQSQWKNYLEIDISPKQMENKVFIKTLKSALPMIFRKGVPLETPLCYSAVKIFEKDNPENLFKLEDKFLNLELGKLKKEQSPKKQKEICMNILNYLKSEALIIPTGKYELSILIRDPFRSVKFNRLNMIDFSQF